MEFSVNLDPYKKCKLCPRDCKIDRTKNASGFCGESADCRVAFLGPHFGEEPSLTGSKGSGTIFFSGCSSRCFFCQNYQISIRHEGRAISFEDLFSEARALILKGVHNLNFVTPDHFWPHIRLLCHALKDNGIKIPTIFNCSGYQRPENVEVYSREIDIFLPDFKFAEPALAKMCMGDGQYSQTALKALREMVKRKGFLRPWDTTGAQTADRGVLVRHLVLPGHVENSLKILKLLHGEFGPELPLSIMSQFRPVPTCARRKTFQRVLGRDEYGQVLDLVVKLGFEKNYTQDLKEETDFLPDFKNPESPFFGNRPQKQTDDFRE